MKTMVIYCFVFLTLSVYSQQEPQFTMFWNNYSLFNPANTGMQYKHFGAINFRNQWVSLDRNPITFTANYDANIKQIGGGAGVGLMYDKIGFMTSNRAYLNYAYHLKLGTSTLSLGIAGFFNRLTFDWTQISSIYPNDPYIGTGIVSQAKYNANFGILFKAKSLELGLSSTQLNEPYYDQLYHESSRHYFLMAAYNFKLSSVLELTTKGYAKTDMQSSMFELNNTFMYNKLFWIGVTVRPSSFSTYGVQTGIQILERYKVGYNFEPSTGISNNYLGPTHEVMMAVMIK